MILVTSLWITALKVVCRSGLLFGVFLVCSGLPTPQTVTGYRLSGLRSGLLLFLVVHKPSVSLDTLVWTPVLWGKSLLCKGFRDFTFSTSSRKPLWSNGSEWFARANQ